MKLTIDRGGGNAERIDVVGRREHPMPALDSCAMEFLGVGVRCTLQATPAEFLELAARFNAMAAPASPNGMKAVKT